MSEAALPKPAPFAVFSTAEARQRGISADQLRGRRFHRVVHGYYVDAPPTEDVVARCAELAAVLPDAVFSHHTAASLYGLPAPEPTGVHVSLRPRRVMPQHAGVVAHGHVLGPDEVQLVAGLPVTSAPRTFLDLAAVIPRIDLIVLGDAMLNRRLSDCTELGELLSRYRRRRGVARALSAVPHLEPLAQSPMETRTRMIYVDGGLPRPRAQIPIVDTDGRVVAHGDMGWEEVCVCSEFEGRHHAGEAQFTYDVGRYTALATLGWAVLRYTGLDVYRRQAKLLAQAWHILRARGMSLDAS